VSGEGRARHRTRAMIRNQHLREYERKRRVRSKALNMEKGTTRRGRGGDLTITRSRYTGEEEDNAPQESIRCT